MSELLMRRSTATTLLLLMMAGLLAPAAVATITSPTPACCRSTGPHHCSTVVTSGTLVRAQSCPYRKPLAFPGSAAAASPSDAVALTDAHPFLQEFYPELFLSDGEQPHPERAPPQSSLK